MPRDVRLVVDRMSDRDWQSLTLQLGRYALQRSRRFYWRTGNSGELPDGEVTESLQDAVLIDIIDAMRNGAATRRDIVKATGRPAGAIDNGLKRLRRVGANVVRRTTHEHHKAR